MLRIYSTLLHDFKKLLFPPSCLGCRKIISEGWICASCLHQIPTTEFHQYPNNPLNRQFYGRVQIEQATAYMFFVHGGIGQQLMHALKYEGKEEIGEDLGHWLGAILKKMPWQIEGIVLVPLHPKKLQKRGYNQCEKFGKALSKALRCPLIDGALIRVRNTQTLTKKNREARWNALEDAFEVVKPQQIEGKHLLLVDDVVTTGTTLETCAKVLLETPGVRVSIAAMCCSIENLP